MKKTVLLAAGVIVMLASCKKDRVCSCKEITKEEYPKKPHYEVVNDYTIEMKDVSLRTGYKACLHTKESYKENDTTTVTIDTNCELK